MRSFVLILVAALVAAVFAATAAGDAVYHTAQLPLQPLRGAPGAGMVINIHANGPTVYAHELYLLKGAVPGNYQVTLHIYPASLSCSGVPVLDLPTASLQTNAVGNGEADVKFNPSDAARLRGLTVSAYWSVVGPASYATACTTITLD